MPKIPTYYILSFSILLFIGCGVDNNNAVTKDSSTISTSKSDSLQRDTFQLRETFNEEDLPVNEYLTEELKPIRANFKRINSISNWTNIKTKDIWETTEGGEAKFYYVNGQLEKITTHHFGETFQKLTEYYLLKGELSFVFEKTYEYNRPIYQDSTAMKEMKDTETFKLEKSEIVEDRSYFNNRKLIHQISSQDCGSSFADSYLIKEQKRIQTDFAKLIKTDRIQ
jgi:hypothetical protein